MKEKKYRAAVVESKARGVELPSFMAMQIQDKIFPKREKRQFGISRAALSRAIVRFRDDPTDQDDPTKQNFFLSNMSKGPVVVNGVKVLTVEKGYQLAKFTPEKIKDFDTKPELRERIQNILRQREGKDNEAVANMSFAEIFMSAEELVSSKTAKKVAKALDEYKRDDWQDNNIALMVDLLIQKFSDPDLARKLLATGKRTLIEGNDWDDTFFGMVKKNDRYEGSNLLGLALMSVRDNIRNGNIPVEGIRTRRLFRFR